MRTSALLTLALGATSVLGGPVLSRSTYAVKGSHPVPQGWRQASKAPSDHELELRIGLTQGDFKGLEKHLFEGKCTAASQIMYNFSL